MMTVTLTLLLEYVFILGLFLGFFDSLSSIQSCIGYLTCESNERAPVFSILHGVFATSLVLRKHYPYSTGMQYSS